jgi:hypothetical protein
MRGILAKQPVSDYAIQWVRQGNRIWNVLKGHGFSRADFRANIAGFSRRGMYWRFSNHSSGAEAHKSSGCFAARLKPCPFKTTMIRLISKARTLHFSLKFQMRLPWETKARPFA